jgi:cytochrome c oxidase subunit III
MSHDHPTTVTLIDDQPFHLVNPSKWPIWTAFGLLGMTVTGAMAMHKMAGSLYALIACALFVGYCAYGWWRDVVKEAEVEHAHTPVVSQGLRVGMGLFIASEVMFFSAFFWAFFNASLFPMLPLEDVWAIAEGVWPPKGIHPFDAWDLPFLNTLILLLSGTTITWAHHALLEGHRDQLIKALKITVGLGVLFTCLQGFEYSHAAFGFKQGVYASTFYMATGFHGAHVIIGTAFLAVCLARATKGHFTPKQHVGFECAAWYWHFVDVVWLFLFVWIYWWGGQ